MVNQRGHSSSSAFSKFSSLVRSKFTSSNAPSLKSRDKSSRDEFIGINFLSSCSSTPNIHRAVCTGGVFHMEEEDVLLNQRQHLAGYPDTFSPLPKYTNRLRDYPDQHEYQHQDGKFRCNSASTKQERNGWDEDGAERLRRDQRHANNDHSGHSPEMIKRTHRSNSAHALATSMYSVVQQQPSEGLAHQLNQVGMSNGQEGRRREASLSATFNGRSAQPEYCVCHAAEVEVANPYDNPSNYYAHGAAHYSSRSLPRKPKEARGVRPSPVVVSTNTPPFPTGTNSSSASCIGRIEGGNEEGLLISPHQHRHHPPLTSPSRGTRRAESMFFGSGGPYPSRGQPASNTMPLSTPIAPHTSSTNQPQMYPNSSSRSTLNSSFIGLTEEHPNHIQATQFPTYKMNSQHSSSSTGTPSSSVENYGQPMGDVFNASANFSSSSNNHHSVQPSTPYPLGGGSMMRMKSRSSNKLTSVFGRHSKVLSPSAQDPTSPNAPWPIDHPHYGTEGNGSYPTNQHEKSIVLYNNSSNQSQPTAIPGCSNNSTNPSVSMSRSSSTQGFVGREQYFEPPQLFAHNHLMVERGESVRRSAQELTEPIIVLAKQLGNKEVEIDRLKSQLSRRSSRNESRCAQYEDELAAQRREADYSREQIAKLKAKLRLCEAECGAMKQKREELERKLEVASATYEQKLDALEKETSSQRKEYTRLKELEEAYEKYLDEKEWVEKHTDSLNQKLDENESSLHLSEQECQHMKLELERLQDVLKEKEAEVYELSAMKAVTSQLGGCGLGSESEQEEEEDDEGSNGTLIGIRERGSLKRRSKQATPKRPSMLLQPSSSSKHNILTPMANSRSSSSTPDSSAAAPSVSSSGVSSFGGGLKASSAQHNHQASMNKQMARCQKKMQACQRRVLALLEATQRISGGGRPNKNDIIGSASESEPDLFDYDHLLVANDPAECTTEKAMEAHCAQLFKLYQNIESLHSGLLAAYGRSRSQVQASNECRVQ